MTNIDDIRQLATQQLGISQKDFVNWKSKMERVTGKRIHQLSIDEIQMNHKFLDVWELPNNKRLF